MDIHALVLRAPDEPDVIDEIYEAAKRGVPKEQVRENLGGRRVYIPASPRARREQQEKILQDLKANRPPKDIARRTGASLRTVYRLRNRLAGM